MMIEMKPITHQLTIVTQQLIAACLVLARPLYLCHIPLTQQTDSELLEAVILLQQQLCNAHSLLSK